MKKTILPILLTLFLTVCTVVSMAQPKPEDQGKTKGGINPGGTPEGPAIGDEPGGGAPVDGGIILLVGMGVAYASKKVYKLYQDNN